MKFKFLKDAGNNILYQYLILLLIVIGCFHYTYDLSILNPINVSWLLEARHDWGQHYLGWAFYRDEPWTFPLGAIESLCYPAGTNVGFWDSIPLFAIIFKPISSFLPVDFQYIGLWLLLCHITTAIYTLKVLRLYQTKFYLIILGVILVSFNPVLVYRGLHPALCAHGLIVASIYYYLMPATSSTVKRINRMQVILAILAALINPYICAMVIGFNIILPLKHYYYDKLINIKKALFYIAASMGGVLLSWLLLGMVSFSNSSDLAVSGAYGLYSLNLNSLYNSQGFSSILPAFGLASEHQYEGFMYIGFGMMLLFLLAILLFFRSYNIKEWLKNYRFLSFLFLLTLLTALFAITHKVTLNEQTLFEVPVPSLIEKAGGIFRASGRFFWLAYYLILLFAIITFIRSNITASVKAGVLILIAALQVYDLNILYTFRTFTSGAYNSPLDEEKWSEAVTPFNRIITYPPFNNHLLNNMDYQDLCYVALKNNKMISTGYSARENTNENLRYTDSLTSSLYKGDLNDEEIYVTTAAYLDIFNKLMRSENVTVNRLDGYYMFYKGGKGIKPDPHISKQIDSIRNLYTEAKFRLVEKRKSTNDKIKHNIEKLDVGKSVIIIRGWAYLQDKINNKGDSVFVTITQGNKTYIADTKQVPRPDVTSAFGKEYLDNSGFNAVIDVENFNNSNFTIGLAIKERNGNYTHLDIKPVTVK